MSRRFSEFANEGPRFILFVTSQDNRGNGQWYGAIKRFSYHEFTIPTQIVTRRVITAQSNRLDSIATKIAIQINCKMGGLAWTMERYPARGVMSVGFDIAKDTSNRNRRYGCIVATMDLSNPVYDNDELHDSCFFSKAFILNGPDCSAALNINMTLALNAYESKYNELPQKIVFYRGGVGEGDFQYLKEIEIQSLKRMLNQRYNGNLKLAYIVVSKKINTRFFERVANNVATNPGCGVVVDDVIVINEEEEGYQEFYMVSQHITQGTANPTNYKIFENTIGVSVQALQSWTWIQTHLYFNWSGTTRVPAVLQYAIKLGFLISNYMHCEPNPNISRKLYFL